MPPDNKYFGSITPT